MTDVMGPFETESQARLAAHTIVRPADGSSVLNRTQNHQLIMWARGQCGLGLGAYDRQIVDWFAGWEDAICAVVAGLITRAYAAGETGGQAVSAPDYNETAVTVYNDDGLGDGFWRNACPVDCGWHGSDWETRDRAVSERASEAGDHQCLRTRGGLPPAFSMPELQEEGQADG